jgi:hypothetical protein
VRCRDEQSKQKRLLIAVSAGLLTIVSITLLSSPPAGSSVFLEQAEPAISHLVPNSAEHGQLHAAAESKLAVTATQVAGSSPKTPGLSANARTTKLEWQQGWQPNGWQLRDGDWPDEGGTFSEGQTYADDPATFKIHQTYAYVPGDHPMSKAEAEADWTEMQKRYFRRTPSRSTYPAVPVVFDEDDEGGHTHFQPIIHKTDNIYINSEHRPYLPAHRRFFPAHARHFKSILHGQELYQVKSSVPKSATSQLGQEYVKSQHQNQELEQELAQVEKESNLAAIVNPAAESTGLSKFVESSPYNFNRNAGETQDWKEVLFMQGALYEMQKKLSDEEEENRKLRNQLAMWKVKDSTPSSKVEKTASKSPTDQSEHQISELKTIIENIESKQKSTDLENEHLRQQLSAIQKLTFKKAKLESGKSPTTSTLSSIPKEQEPSAAHEQHSRSGAAKVTVGGAAQSSKIRSDGAHVSVASQTVPSIVTHGGSVHTVRQPAAPMASKSATSLKLKPTKPAAAAMPAMPAKPAKPAAAAAVEVKPAGAVAAKPAAAAVAAAAVAAVTPHSSVSFATQAKPVAASPAKAKAVSATIVAKAAAASAVAFRQASLATKDAVVRALAADEELSLDSDTDAIFGSGTAVDEEGDVGHDGFDRLHSLERSALGGARR